MLRLCLGRQDFSRSPWAGGWWPARSCWAALLPSISTSTIPNDTLSTHNLFLATVVATEMPAVNTFDCDGEICFGVYDCGCGTCVLQDLIRKLWKNLFLWSDYLGLHLNIILVFAELVY